MFSMMTVMTPKEMTKSMASSVVPTVMASMMPTMVTMMTAVMIIVMIMVMWISHYDSSCCLRNISWWHLITWRWGVISWRHLISRHLLRKWLLDVSRLHHRHCHWLSHWWEILRWHAVLHLWHLHHHWLLLHIAIHVILGLCHSSTWCKLCF